MMSRRWANRSMAPWGTTTVVLPRAVSWSWIMVLAVELEETSAVPLPLTGVTVESIRKVPVGLLSSIRQLVAVGMLLTWTWTEKRPWASQIGVTKLQLAALSRVP